MIKKSDKMCCQRSKQSLRSPFEVILSDIGTGDILKIKIDAHILKSFPLDIYYFLALHCCENPLAAGYERVAGRGSVG